MESQLNQYEAMFLLSVAAVPDADAAVALCRGIIERHAGQILVIKKWDERKLAYEIRGQKRGLYVISFFNAPGPAIAAIEHDVNLSEQVLRVLVTRADHLNPQEMAAVEPQPIIPREERPSWDRPYSDRPERSGDRGGDRGGDRPRPPRRDDIPAESAKD